MILASCAKERAEQDSVRNESHQEIQGTVVTIQAALGSQDEASQDTPVQNAAATKTTQTGGTYSWAAGETISVGTSAGSYTTFDLVDAATGTFTHTFDGDAPDLQMAVSPAQSGSYTGTTNFTVSLPTVYNDYVSGTTNALMIGTPDPETENKFLFHHAAALIKVTYNNVPIGTKGLVLTMDQNIAGSVSLTSSDDVITTGMEGLSSNSVTIRLSTSIASAEQSVIFYIPVPTGTYNSMSINLIDSNTKKLASTTKTSSKQFSLERKDIFVLPAASITNVTIGDTNNTSEYGVGKSDAIELYKGKRLTMEFVNYSRDGSSQLWFNWVLRNANSSNATQFVVRADNYAWSGDNTANNISSNFTHTANWNKSFLNGANVFVTIDYDSDGKYDLTANAISTGGSEKYLEFEYTNNSNPLSVYLYTDNSHYEYFSYKISDIPEEPEPDPEPGGEDSNLSSVSIKDHTEWYNHTVSNQYIGRPTSECGLTIIATFKDGSTQDITSLATYSPSTISSGWQSVTVSYSKTKNGNSDSEKSTHFYITAN